MKSSIYMDAHATTPVDPRVLEEMLPYFTERFGNAASRNHAYGWEAEEAVDAAREKVATAIGAEAKEIIWTSGATESDNLALIGAAEMAPAGRDHLIVSTIEHKAILDTAAHLERRGFRVSCAPAESTGLVDLDKLASLLNEKTFLVSIMTANNEVGTIQPIAEIARLVHDRSAALFHTDAVQAIGNLAVSVREAGIDLLSLSGHKVYGPKGVGALFVRRRPLVRLAPLLHGGGHERGMRSGTLNVPAIVGVGKALEIAMQELDANRRHAASLRDRLREGIFAQLDGVFLNGHPVLRLPNNLHLSFARVEAEDLLREIPGIAVSTGAACSSASVEPSHVMSALGLGTDRAQSSIRFGITRFNTEAEVDVVIDRIVQGVRKLRALAVQSEAS
ncbi:MAG TPA: aminotransferase class V-fold PLP-dependent enzyme [bacterium]|nr:aminotransferase class V-fold PLP-dependent enzyme [bacterium]